MTTTACQCDDELHAGHPTCPDCGDCLWCCGLSGGCGEAPGGSVEASGGVGTGDSASGSVRAPGRPRSGAEVDRE